MREHWGDTRSSMRRNTHEYRFVNEVSLHISYSLHVEGETVFYIVTIITALKGNDRVSYQKTFQNPSFSSEMRLRRLVDKHAKVEE